jgi:uncharacterized protein YndB with AHSA1/START domain
MSIDRSVVVPLSPDETFALITEPERLRRWQAVTARIDLRAGDDSATPVRTNGPRRRIHSTS